MHPRLHERTLAAEKMHVGRQSIAATAMKACVEKIVLQKLSPPPPCRDGKDIVFAKWEIYKSCISLTALGGS